MLKSSSVVDEAHTKIEKINEDADFFKIEDLTLETESKHDLPTTGMGSTLCTWVQQSSNPEEVDGVKKRAKKVQVIQSYLSDGQQSGEASDHKTQSKSKRDKNDVEFLVIKEKEDECSSSSQERLQTKGSSNSMQQQSATVRVDSSELLTYPVIQSKHTLSHPEHFTSIQNERSNEDKSYLLNSP